MAAQENIKARATELLQSILDRAVECGAGMVELERVPEGLEIMYIAGHTGVGDVLRDSNLEAALVGLIVDRAGLAERTRGKLIVEVKGQRRDVSVETYDSFGEWCFRLKFRAKKRRS